MCVAKSRDIRVCCSLLPDLTDDSFGLCERKRFDKVRLCKCIRCSVLIFSPIENGVPEQERQPCDDRESNAYTSKVKWEWEKRWQDVSADRFTGVWECLLAFARARGKLRSDVCWWWWIRILSLLFRAEPIHTYFYIRARPLRWISNALYIRNDWWRMRVSRQPRNVTFVYTHWRWQSTVFRWLWICEVSAWFSLNANQFGGIGSAVTDAIRKPNRRLSTISKIAIMHTLEWLLS